MTQSPQQTWKEESTYHQEYHAQTGCMCLYVGANQEADLYSGYSYQGMR